MRHCDRRRRGAQRGATAARLTAVVVALLLLAVVAVLAIQQWPEADDDDTPAAPTTTPAPLREPEPPAPGIAFEEPAAAKPVLAAAATQAVSARRVRQRLAKLVRAPALGRHLGLVVQQLAGGRPLVESGRSGLVTPASTMKLLTTAAAVHLLGPEHRFTTKVVRGASRREIVLVGGGDPLLTDRALTPEQAQATYPQPASLQDLAARTARALHRTGATQVRLGYDATLFRGPAVSPRWEPGYVPDNVVSRISALWTNEGRVAYGFAQRAPDPAAEAAAQFADLLSQRGVTVTGAATVRRAGARAPVLAQVESPVLASIVQHILEVSDNEGAEILLRHVGVASGHGGSFTGGAAGVRETLTSLGIDLSGARLNDGSGLSRSDLVPVEALVEVLQTAADPAYPNLRSVVSTLPVAGFTGSLDYRFVGDAPGGLGLVRAKTGTLTGVHGLAGIVSTRNGGALVFAAVADQVPVPRTQEARDQLDRIAAALAGCGC